MDEKCVYIISVLYESGRSLDAETLCGKVKAEMADSSLTGESIISSLESLKALDLLRETEAGSWYLVEEVHFREE